MPLHVGGALDRVDARARRRRPATSRRGAPPPRGCGTGSTCAWPGGPARRARRRRSRAAAAPWKPRTARARCGPRRHPTHSRWTAPRDTRRLTAPPRRRSMSMKEKSQAAMRALLEGLPDAIVGRPAGRLDRVRQRARRGAVRLHARPSCSAARSPMLWPERVRERYERNTALYFQLEHPLRFTARAYGLRRDGTEFVGEMSWGIVEGDDGPMLLAVGRDITERLEAERRLRRQSDEQAAVAALGERALRGVAPGDLAREAAERVGMALSADRVLIVEPSPTAARRAGRAGRVGRRRGSAGRAGGRDGGDARAGAGRGRRRLERRDPHGRGGVRRDHRLRHRRRRTSSAPSSSRSPTCSPRPTRACAPSSGSATRRCTTR